MTGGPVRELAVGETRLAWEALRELRPGLRDSEHLVRLVDEVQREQGYRLLGVFVGGTAHAVAVAGIRDVDHLSWGAATYVDDLVTMAAHRGRGHARELLRWIEDDTRSRGRVAVHLDSGHARHDAHRLYLASGFRMTSHHFVKQLDGG